MSDYQLLYDTQEPPTLTMAPVEDSSASFGLPSITDGAGGTPEPSDAGARMATIFDAAKRSQMYDGASNSEAVASQDALQQKLDRIRAATGVVVDNPLRASPLTGQEMDDPYASPQDRAALGAYAADHPDYTPGQMLDTSAQIAAAPYRANALQSRLSELRSQFPDQASIFDAPSNGADLARQANSDLASAPGAGVGGLLAQLAGGMVGAMRDPLQVAALAVGGGEVKATTLGLRMLESGARQAAVNAGVQALSEPAVQDWRKQVGLDSGFVPAAEDVGFAALFGMIPGMAMGALHGAHVDPAALRADMTAAAGGDADAAARVTALIPPEAHGDIATALDAGRLDKEAAPPVPKEFRPDDVSDLYRDAVRFGEDATAPLPEPAPPIGRDVTDAAAIGAVKDASNWSEAVQTLRGDPSLIASALASDRQDIRALGRLATLSDDALSRVQEGGIDPLHAQHVAALTSDPDAQAALLDDMRRTPPANEDAARAMASESLQARNLGDAQASILPGDVIRPSEAAIMAASRDPLDMALSGELSSQSAGDIATALRGHVKALEGEVLGDRADEWRTLQGQSRAAWNAGNDAKGKGIDRRIEAIEGALPAGDRDKLYGVGMPDHANPDDWRDLARRLGDVEASRDDATDVIASEVRDLPNTLDPKAMTPNEREAVAIIHHAMAEEVKRGGDPKALLRNAFAERFDRYGRDEDAADVVEDQMRQLAELMGEKPKEAKPPARKPASRPRDLVSFLRAAGGIRDTGGDLKALGFNATGRRNGLINDRTGLHPDHARELAAEAGFLGDDIDHAMSETTVNDLLDALDGPARYAAGDRDKIADRAAAARAAEQRARQFMTPAEARRQIEKAVGFNDEPNPMIMARAADHLVYGEETDPLHAWDRAALDTERDLIDHSDRFEALQDDDEIPFDDDAIASQPGSTSFPGDAPARDEGEKPGVGGLQGQPGGSARSDGEGVRAPGIEASGELIDRTPMSERVDGGDMRALSDEEIQRVGDHEDLLARFVEDCAL